MKYEIKVLLEELWTYFDENPMPTEQEEYYLEKLSKILNKDK